MVPEGWRECRLGDIVQGGVKNGYSPLPADKETGYWVLSLGALSDGSFNPTAIKPITPTETVAKNILVPGDFLISRSNTPEKVGRVAMFRGELVNCSYPDLMMRFRVDESEVIPEYIEILLKWPVSRRYFQRSSAGSSATMVKIKKSVVENTPLLLPEKDEQVLIWQILSTWNNAIATTEKLIQNSEAQQKALMCHLFNIEDGTSTRSGKLLDYTLEEIVSERNENGVSGLPLLSITRLDGVVDQNTVGRKDSSSSDKRKYKRICPGDIGYNTMRMWQGVSALSQKEGVVSPAYTVLKVNSDFDALYVSYLFKLPRMIHEFYKHSQGLVSDTWNLKFRYLKSIKVRLPDRNEQKKIASILLQASKLTRDLHNSREFLLSEKAFITDQLLTGKLRVKPNDSVL